MKDFRGNEYGIGDTIVYATRSGNSAKMTEGVIVDIRKIDQYGRPSTQLVVRATKEGNFRYNYDTNSYEVSARERGEKNSYITNLDCVVVV